MQNLIMESFGAMTPSAQRFADIVGARDEIEQRLLVQPEAFGAEALKEGTAGLGNVVGVGVGIKSDTPGEAGPLAIKVFVREKLPIPEVAAAALVPTNVQGVPTDVEAIGEVIAEQPGFSQRLRPPPGGVSTGHCSVVMAGTLGCFATDARGLYALSNNHVFALSNGSSAGASNPQPGRLDGGVCPNDEIGKLDRFIRLDFSGNANVVDAALARVPEGFAVDRRIIRAGGGRQALASPHRVPALNMRVQKSGRTTGHTRGVIDTVGVSIRVGYGAAGVAYFTGQARVTTPNGTFSAPGDSGSLVATDPDNHPVGLLFAGGTAGAIKVTFCNDIGTVLSLLRAAIAY